VKRIAALLVLLSLLLCMATTVSAHDVPQERDDCSIEVAVRFNGKDITGGTLTAIKVGYVAEDDGNYFFCQELTGILLDDIASPDAPKAQEEFYKNNKADYEFYAQTQSVKNGKATFSGLSTGLYLIVQNKAASGYSKMKPFLVSVPYMEDGVYQYHVTATVKSELEREPEKAKPSKPADPSLPQTGQTNWPVPLMAATGLILFVIGWLLCFRKKENME
jgi:LPXTG-motif cell wall-anchored protein